jgi:hypothetical protein
VKVPPPAPDADAPIKGGPKTARAAEEQLREVPRASPGTPLTHREVYVLSLGGPREALVLPAGAGGRDKALPVFTDYEHAILYIQSAGLRGCAPVSLSPIELGYWLRLAPARGVTLLAVDPSWLAQQRGEPQPALSLEGWGPDQADALYREIRALEHQLAV